MRRLSRFVSSDLGRRVQRVFSAQMLNQFATIAVQLGLVPVLLVAWGKSTYGVWLLLSAIPSYLTFSDLGFTQIAKNEMLMLVSAGRRVEALRTFHSVFALLNAACPALFVLVCGFVLLAGPNVVKLGDYPTGPARTVIVLLLATVLSHQYFLLICAGVRSGNRVATEATWGACARLAEGLAVGSTAMLGGGLVAAAVATLASRLAFSILIYLWLRRASPWLYLGYAHARWSEIRRLLQPAMAFMLLPLSQALLIQAPILILGALLGPVPVVTFSTTRTLTRVGTAGVSILNGTLQGEYGLAFARGDARHLGRIFRWHQLASAAAIAAYCLVLYASRDWLMRLYTHARVPVVEPFFSVMTLAIAAEMMWSSIATPISSVNRHVSLAHALLVVCVAGTAVCYVATRQLGLVGMALGLLAIHLTSIAVCYGLRKNISAPRGPAAAAVSP